MSAPIKTRKKLIEVALPLDKINEASAREKSIRHGHPSTLHLWWARRPLAAARAVIFAQMVDDPSEYVATLLGIPEKKREAERELKRRRALWEALPTDAERGEFPTLEEAAADVERGRLFKIIEELVQWENTTSEFVLDKARAEIWQSWRRACSDNAGNSRGAELFDRHKLPAFHDPFAGGGALPLEAQRLGLEAFASDLNPVPVLINKAMIEIPPKFAGLPPVNPEADPHRAWNGVEGLADDVRYYGKWMRDEAEKRIGHLYPKVKVTAEMAANRPDLKPYVDRELTVIAWLWARTVKSPNPAFRDVEVPLASTFMLVNKPGKEAWIEPVINGRSYCFKVRLGKPANLEATKTGTKTGHGSNFRCIMSGAPIESGYVKSEGMKNRIGKRLMAIVAQGDRTRIYLPGTEEQEQKALGAHPDWYPDIEISGSTQYLGVKPYGISTFAQLYTERQLVVLNIFSDLILEVKKRIIADSSSIAVHPDRLHAYSDAVATYLAFAVSKVSDRGSTLGRWDPTPTQSGIINTFSRQALSMTWDFAESNPLGNASGNLTGGVDLVAKAISAFPCKPQGHAEQANAAVQTISRGKVISTDPPYYDNVPYADLSDYFYVWLRKSIGSIQNSLFSTLTTPKDEELVAFAYRHNNIKSGAEKFFLSGMTNAMHTLAELAHPAFPTTIYYAFKQSEERGEGTASTGWETFLDAVVQAGFAISGTWPMRTELGNRIRGLGSNALATSIVLVCRPRSSNAPSATRREFLNALKAELPSALHHLQGGNIAPVDLAQAAIGPGMAVFSRYSEVLDADGKPISVREALTRINEVLDEVLASQEGDFDPDTRWAVTWFDQFGFDEGEYGQAEQLSKAKNTAVAEMADVRNGGIVIAKAGKVRLTRPEELPADWNPATDPRLTVWEMVHHLIRRMDEGGEASAAELLAALGVKAEIARELAYRLYAICERKKRAADALAYNSLVQSWPEITRLARDLVASGATGPAQAELAI